MRPARAKVCGSSNRNEDTDSFNHTHGLHIPCAEQGTHVKRRPVWCADERLHECEHRGGHQQRQDGQRPPDPFGHRSCAIRIRPVVLERLNLLHDVERALAGNATRRGTLYQKHSFRGVGRPIALAVYVTRGVRQTNRTRIQQAVAQHTLLAMIM
jgi:hypothetical protein